MQQIRTLYHLTDLPTFIRATYGDLTDYPASHHPLLAAIRDGRAAEAEEVARQHVIDAGYRLAEILHDRDGSALRIPDWAALRAARELSNGAGDRLT
jgi:DNA-binding GntR family transcriptional regulator